MSKYTYTQVEHLSDLDITGNTQYYLFEEGVGHKEFEKEKMKRCSLYGLESYIEERTIFTREEKPWYENIPDNGILCWEGSCESSIVWIRHEPCVDDDGNAYHFNNKGYELSLRPLTNQEIKEFLQEEE